MLLQLISIEIIIVLHVSTGIGGKQYKNIECYCLCAKNRNRNLKYPKITIILVDFAANILQFLIVVT